MDNYDSSTALTLAGELLRRGVAEAAFPIYMISQYAEPTENLSWDSFTSEHVDLLESLSAHSRESWALRALTNLCAARPDLAKQVKRHAEGKRGLDRALLEYSVSRDFGPVFEALIGLVDMSDDERKRQPMDALEDVDLDWTGGKSCS